MKKYFSKAEMILWLSSVALIIGSFCLFDKENKVLLCGTDMMLNFDKWKDAEQIFKICYPIYIRRESNFSLNDKIISKNNEYYQKYGVAFRRIVVDPIEISSSEIRNMIKIGMAELNVCLPPDAITTLGLGSCVGVVLYDPAKKVICYFALTI